MKHFLKVPSDSSAVFWATGDWHIGSRFHNSKLFEQHLSRALKEGWYLLHVGDGLEMVNLSSTVSRRGAIWEQEISPADQLKKLVEILAHFPGGFYLPGNHERRLYMDAGINIVKELAEASALKVEVLEIPTIVGVRVGRQEYNIFIHHGEAAGQINPTLLLDRLQRDLEDVDIIVAGHIHASTFDPTERVGRNRVRVLHRIRVGHYLQFPRYALEKPVGPLRASGSWTITLGARQREIVPSWLGPS